MGDRDQGNLGKLRAPDDLPTQRRLAAFEPLPVIIEHAMAVGELAAHHADPFDRLLIAQSRTEELTLVTRDARILDYDVTSLHA